MAGSDDNLFGAEHVRVYHETGGQRGCAEGSERARPWSLMTEAWPAYDDYQIKTGREIPVVVLSRR